jgi:hypothetical protein
VAKKEDIKKVSNEVEYQKNHITEDIFFRNNSQCFRNNFGIWLIYWHSQ